ncbi:glutaminyl-tRNA synthetase [Photobacterium angustum S14]|uniref:Glutaminyl-tRNA synthetase n=1 Tax=Photobacterium angustum (strain S14 / CCUG 15956) TaxID=314292 RepID=Q1ZP56_PHOAS|nr:glutaminyl-tRNA synthetase [Photobacterium angustum S14]
MKKADEGYPPSADILTVKAYLHRNL